jgi:hypothetical protein
MGAQLTTLASADIQRFDRDGYVVVRQAFSRTDALAMQRQWWRELEDTHDISPDDHSSWRQITGDLKAAMRALRAKILTERVRGVFDDLLGPALPLSPACPRRFRPLPYRAAGRAGSRLANSCSFSFRGWRSPVVS